MRALAIAAVGAQAGIAVTGSVVRVTGSGLGCPDWPACFPGSLTPSPRYSVPLLHQWVEFGNRLLVGVVSVVALTCLLAALATRPRQRRVTILAAAMPLGVLAQAVIGGMTVLLGLAWWTVSVHFLVSMLLVWLAVLLVRASGEVTAPPGPVLPRPLRTLVTLCTVVLAALLTAGMMVTAAGPHAGDLATPRLGIAMPTLVQLHANLLIVYLGLLSGLGFGLHAVHAPRSVLGRFRVLVVAVLAQGALGATQYALGVPASLVSLHVLGACVVTIAAAALWASVIERPGQPTNPRARPQNGQPIIGRANTASTAMTRNSPHR
ncbi:MAG: heme A synthase [Pseudonocardia sp.]|nr:heme A synthase [Pseudonocardia sp.]